MRTKVAKPEEKIEEVKDESENIGEEEDEEG
jgi:hypothetical protein